jgi:hypothetical protein
MSIESDIPTVTFAANKRGQNIGDVDQSGHRIVALLEKAADKTAAGSRRSSARSRDRGGSLSRPRRSCGRLASAYSQRS